MAKIILDKNLTTEKEIEVTNVFERILDNLLNGVYSVILEEGQPIPTIPTITNRSFTTIEVVTGDGESIPLACDYNYIESFSTQYYEKGRQFSYNIDIINKEE